MMTTNKHKEFLFDMICASIKWNVYGNNMTIKEAIKNNKLLIDELEELQNDKQ